MLRLRSSLVIVVLLIAANAGADVVRPRVRAFPAPSYEDLVQRVIRLQAKVRALEGELAGVREDNAALEGALGVCSGDLAACVEESVAVEEQLQACQGSLCPSVEVLCDRAFPECPPGTVMVGTGTCSVACVDPGSCERRCGDGETVIEGECRRGCRGDDGCYTGEVCNAPDVCLTDPSCPMCAVCFGWCEPNPCSDGSALTCRMHVPVCEAGTQVAIVDGCYQCLEPDTCLPPCEGGRAEDGACCPGTIYVQDCWCEEGTASRSWSEYDEHGCLLGTACECVSVCEADTHWDADLDACCTDTFFVADCWCTDGQVLETGEVHDENGCFLGTTCECIDCRSGSTGDDGQCCPDVLWIADCMCAPGTVPSSSPVYENGCLVGYGCGCEPVTCEEGSYWDEDLATCCPLARFIADCWCAEGTEYHGTVITDDNGCTLGNGCECRPICDDGDYYDEDVGACCPAARFVADCWCPEGTEYASFPITNDLGCTLGTGCDCVTPD